MPSILNSDDGVVSGTSGLKSTGGNDGLLNIQSNGSTIVAVTGSGISVTGTVSQTGVSTFAAGTVSAPSITFTGDTNTGIFSPAADTVGFTTGGSERMRITSNGTVIVAATSSSFDTTYSALQISSTGALANYAPSGDFNMTSGLYYAGGEWKYTTTGLKGSRFQVANQGIQAIAGTNASPTAGGSATQSTILYLTYNNTLALQNATQSAGTGIAFPATQNASSNANTLDDYEEGNWTPTVSGQTVAGTGTYTTQLGRYTKVGRLVTVEVYLNWTAHTGSGAMLFSNLPFTTNSFINSAGSVSYVNNIALTANNVFTIYTNTASTNISCSQYPVGGGAQSAVTLDTSADLVYSITYSVDN